LTLLSFGVWAWCGGEDILLSPGASLDHLDHLARAVKSRIKSVANIKKITSAMKMVAASKMRRAQAAQIESKGLPATFLKLFGEETSATLPALPVAAP
jgi:ATP synthase